MKEKYNRAYDADENIAINFISLGITFIAALFIGLATHSITGGTLTAIFIPSLVRTALNAIRSEFEAKKTCVTFRYLIKETTIRYKDITNMKLERKNQEYQSRSGLSRGYIETLTITANGEDHVYSTAMDIDYDKVAEDPASLQEQFDNSKFSKLKRYIEDNMGIISRS